MARLGIGRIATVVGRYYAMDRDKRWERTKLAYDAHASAAIAPGDRDSRRLRRHRAVVRRRASPTSSSSRSSSSMRTAKPVGPIRDGDSVVFFNFRADRARQITRALALATTSTASTRPDRPRVHATTMTVYDRTFNLPVVFTPQTFSGNLADVLAAHGRTNLRLAETEKYAHVTYFFNCGREEPYPGEDRILVPSQKVADLRPDARDERARHHRRARRGPRRRGRHQVVICNFANADMVGHTGSSTPRSRPSKRWTAAWAGS